MRAYSIVITTKSGKTITYSSWVDNVPQGKINPNALNIEIDGLVTSYATPGSDSGVAVRIWGISLQDIASANNLVGANIAVYAGMAKGLPLANPKQYGKIIQGYVYQAYGNWIGTQMTLDLVILAGSPGIGTGTKEKPVNLTGVWRAGQTLAVFLGNILTQAFPAANGYKIGLININPNLVNANDIPVARGTLTEFATWIKQKSQGIIGGSYPGVDIALNNNTTFTVLDGTPSNGSTVGATETNPIQISYLDLIGQPTWIAFPSIQLFCVMRGDLDVLNFIKLPPGLITTTASALSAFKNDVNFTGVFQISSLRFAGNFRQPPASSWVTVIEGYPAYDPEI